MKGRVRDRRAIFVLTTTAFASFFIATAPRATFGCSFPEAARLFRCSMWQYEKRGSIEGLPSYAQALKDYGNMDMSQCDIDARMAYHDSGRLY